MKENKENLKTKKTVVFQTMSTKKTPILTFLPTSNSSFKLTEQLIVFTNLKKKGYETRNNEDSVFRSQNKIIKKW